jgi:uncharacterized protein YciI
MARDPNIPDEFDVYTVCILTRPKDSRDFTPERLDELQAGHLAYRAGLHRQKLLVANGPFDAQSDISLRGLSIFACDLKEAARLNDGDPMVQAGRLGYELTEWWVAAGTIAFPGFDGRVGDRRTMSD